MQLYVIKIILDEVMACNQGRVQDFCKGWGVPPLIKNSVNGSVQPCRVLNLALK